MIDDRRKSPRPAFTSREQKIIDEAVDRTLALLRITDVENHIEQREVMTKWFTTMMELDKARAEKVRARTEAWRHIRSEVFVSQAKELARYVTIGALGFIAYAMGPHWVHALRAVFGDGG